MLLTPLTEQVRQQEWKTICTITRINGFQLQIIYNLKNKLILKHKKQKIYSQTQRKKWITFAYHSSLVHRITNLFKSTDLNIAFQMCNTIYTTSYAVGHHKTK